MAGISKDKIFYHLLSEVFDKLIDKLLSDWFEYLAFSGERYTPEQLEVEFRKHFGLPKDLGELGLNIGKLDVVISKPQDASIVKSYFQEPIMFILKIIYNETGEERIISCIELPPDLIKNEEL